MYEYKFIKLKVKGIIERKTDPDYHGVVSVYAKEGWRLVQILAPPIGGYGVAPYFELIFERKI